MHIAVVGVGNVGRSTAFRILTTGLPEELTLVDTKPGLAHAIAEEFKHAAAGMGLSAEINWYEKDEELSGVDIVVITAGFPRPQDVRISRRELMRQNAGIIKELAEILPPRNPSAKYVVVTNPVDANAMLFRKLSRAPFVIGTGNHLETLRFRAKLAEVLGIPRKYVSGYVGGEHGEEATILWSTASVLGKPLSEYLKGREAPFRAEDVEAYIKEVPELVIDYSGATRFGPAEAFTEIIKSIALDENRVFSVATPVKLEGFKEETYVNVPTVIGMEIRDRMLHWLSPDELRRIKRAAEAIRKTYENALEMLGL
ncbi:MAG: hypothetical protein J7L55_01570 [Desulfurococcales archaeon]|nr:hypothetical protein [Desulfurococcales archaeon]